MTFSPQAPLGTGPVQAPFLNLTLDLMTILQMTILAIVAIVVALLVVRPILAAPKDVALPSLAAPLGDGAVPDLEPISGEIDFGSEPENMMTIYDGEALPDANSVAGQQPLTTENPIQRLREMIETRQEETVEILRHWLEQKEQTNS